MQLDSITTVLVEDHEITRLAMKLMLQRLEHILLVAEAADGITAITKVNEFKPDLVLMDIGLPGVDGITATKSIKTTLPATKVIIITSHENDEDLFAGLLAGADAYCLKGASFDQLSTAISSVMAGATWLHPRITPRVIARVAQTLDKEPLPTCEHGTFGLTARESEVLALLVAGCTNSQMASQLCLSPEAMNTHLRHVMEKLQVSDRTQAAIKAVHEGLVSRGGPAI